MSVILLESANPGESGESSGKLVSVEDAEVGHSKRKLLPGPAGKCFRKFSITGKRAVQQLNGHSGHSVSRLYGGCKNSSFNSHQVLLAISISRAFIRLIATLLDKFIYHTFGVLQVLNVLLTSYFNSL